MIKINHLLAALLFTSISAAHAATPNQPVSQGEASVNKNLAKDPDNKGLQNAAQQLETNEARIAAKREAANKKNETRQTVKNKEEIRERNRAERREHEMVEHPEKPERFERPEKPERPGR